MDPAVDSTYTSDMIRRRHISASGIGLALLANAMLFLQPLWAAGSCVCNAAQSTATQTITSSITGTNTNTPCCSPNGKCCGCCGPSDASDRRDSRDECCSDAGDSSSTGSSCSVSDHEGCGCGTGCHCSETSQDAPQVPAAPGESRTELAPIVPATGPVLCLPRPPASGNAERPAAEACINLTAAQRCAVLSRFLC